MQVRKVDVGVSVCGCRVDCGPCSSGDELVGVLGLQSWRSI
jgi:hypothetical protein